MRCFFGGQEFKRFSLNDVEWFLHGTQQFHLLGKFELPSKIVFPTFFTAGWGPSSLAKLVQTTIITVVYDTQITIFRWGYNPAYNWRAPSCVVVCFTPKKRVMAGDCRGLPLYLNRRVCHGEWPCFIPGHVPWWTLKFQGSRRLKSNGWWKHHHPFVKSTKHGFLGEISSVHQHLWCVNPCEIHHFLPLGLPSVEIWGLLDLCYLDGRGGMGNGWWNGWFTHVSHIYIYIHVYRNPYMCILYFIILYFILYIFTLYYFIFVFYYIILYYITLYIILYYTILYQIVLFVYIILFDIVFYYLIFYYLILYYIVYIHMCVLLGDGWWNW